MILRWEGDVALGDAEAVAKLYGVSTRTVRRRCPVARRYPPAGPGTVQALYDAVAAADTLAPVVPRSRETAQRLLAQRPTGCGR